MVVLLRAPTLKPLAAALLVAWSSATPARATNITVPDQAPTIQAALDAGVDTVLVRPGSYAETPTAVGSVTLLGAADGSSALPVIDGLRIAAYVWGEYSFQGLRFDHFVVTASHHRVVSLRFVECELQGGLLDSSGVGYIDDIALSRCRVAGSLAFPGAIRVALDTCEVAGNVYGMGEDLTMRVRGCTIQGGVAATHHQSTSTVTGNTIRGGYYGVSAEGNDIVIADNVIEDCQSDGIYVYGEDVVTITNNTVRRCRVGINARTYERLSIIGNTIEQSRSTGIAVGPTQYADVIGNTMWMCTDGMMLGFDAGRMLTNVRQNTSCYNGLSGFVSDQDRPLEWTGNIGYGNGQYGVRWLRTGTATIACNDYLANRIGAVQGRPFAGADLAVDPQFCDALGGDLRLDSASPLLDAPGCGPVGALGAGCGATTAAPAVEALPVASRLVEVGPSPGCGPLRIEFTLGRAAAIEVAVFDVRGRRVAWLARGDWPAGAHSVEWNGRTLRGQAAPAGVYVLRYSHPGGEDRRRIVRVP